MNRFRAYWVKVGGELKNVLGNRCAKCGRRHMLQFDCKVPQGDEHHRFETNRRISFYRKQYAAGNLQLLCEPCQIEKSKGEQYWQWNAAWEMIRKSNEPF